MWMRGMRESWRSKREGHSSCIILKPLGLVFPKRDIDKQLNLDHWQTDIHKEGLHDKHKVYVI